MRRLRCQSCGAEVPMGDLYQVFGRTLCESCGDSELASRALPRVPEGAVTRLSDPTVCHFCKSDQGSLDLPVVAGLPTCPACEGKFLRPPLPRWVKAAALVILVLGGVELARNWRLFQAFFEIPRAGRAMQKGDIEEAWRQMARAAAHVPEMPELRTQEQFLHALVCLRKRDFDQAVNLLEAVRRSHDKETAAAADLYLMVAKASRHLDEDQHAQALQLGRQIRDRYPDNKIGEELIEAAEIGDAFTRKDYAAFEAKARQSLQRRPDDPMAAAQLASALACRYASTGQEKYKTEALSMMERARKGLAGREEQFKEYEERILHRLNTRQIIDRKEYDRRFRPARKGETP